MVQLQPNPYCLSVVAGAVAGRGGDARVQDAVVERPPLHDSPLLAVQSRLGLARAHSRPLHGYHHAVRRRLPPQRRRPRSQGPSNSCLIFTLPPPISVAEWLARLTAV